MGVHEFVNNNLPHHLFYIFLGVPSLNWLYEIFEAKSDQARLIAILITAIIAILIVLLNQWFLSRRAKRELLTEKIEELYSASCEYVSSCKELMDSLKEHRVTQPKCYFDPQPEIINKISDSITKMQMICGLYFREEKFTPNEYYIFRMPIIGMEHKGTTHLEGEAYMAHQESLIHIVKSKDKLDELCKKLMKKHGH